MKRAGIAPFACETGRFHPLTEWIAADGLSVRRFIPWGNRAAKNPLDIAQIQPYGCTTMQTTTDFDAVFSALADATRRDIVRRAIDGEEGVAELAGHYPMSFAAVQKHVAILERAGLVTKRRLGRRKVVRTNPAGLLVARRLLDQYEELWRGRIDRMTELVSQEKEIRP